MANIPPWMRVWWLEDPGNLGCPGWQTVSGQQRRKAAMIPQQRPAWDGVVWEMLLPTPPQSWMAWAPLTRSPVDLEVEIGCAGAEGPSVPSWGGPGGCGLEAVPWRERGAFRDTLSELHPQTSPLLIPLKAVGCQGKWLLSWAKIRGEVDSRRELS